MALGHSEQKVKLTVTNTNRGELAEDNKYLKVDNFVSYIIDRGKR